MDEKTLEDGDRELVTRILGGDREAFTRLVEKYHPRISRLVFGIVGDWQQSEDVCQEIFVSVYLKLSTFGFRSRFSTWMYRVSVNAALKARGRAANRREFNLDEAGTGPGRDDPSPGELEGAELLSKLLRPLPRHLRVVVLLKEKEGLTYKEIAAVIGCTSGAVEQRLHRAFTKLREIWKDRFGDLGLEARRR